MQLNAFMQGMQSQEKPFPRNEFEEQAYNKCAACGHEGHTTRTCMHAANAMRANCNIDPIFMTDEACRHRYGTPRPTHYPTQHGLMHVPQTMHPPITPFHATNPPNPQHPGVIIPTQAHMFPSPAASAADPRSAPSLSGHGSEWPVTIKKFSTILACDSGRTGARRSREQDCAGIALTLLCDSDVNPIHVAVAS